jgi:hypothetical protein
MLRFHRSIRLFPGVRLNIGKRGIGISAGRPGLRVGIDSRGRRFTSAGIVGTGLSVRKYEKQDAGQGSVGEELLVIALVIAAVVIIAALNAMNG